MRPLLPLRPFSPCSHVMLSLASLSSLNTLPHLRICVCLPFPLLPSARPQVTATFPIDLGLLHPSIQLGALLDPASPALGCYTYADPPRSAV